MTDQMVDPFVRAAVKKLFRSNGYFCICDYDKICKVLNVIPPEGVRDRLSLAHCLHYRDMEPSLREELARLCFETFNTPGFSLDIEGAVQIGGGKVAAITGRIRP